VECEKACITNGKSKTFPKGNFVVFRDRNETHWLEFYEEANIRMIDFKAELFGHMVRDYSDFSEMIMFLFSFSNFKGIDVKSDFIEDTDGRLKELFTDSWQEYKSRNYKWEEVVKNNIYKIILEYVRRCENNSVSHMQTDLVQSVVDYLENNYDKKMTQKEIAEKFNCSEAYIIKLFKKEFGMSLAEYLKQRRIFRGIELIKNNYKISDVAKMVGYDDADVFTRHFSYYMGMTPSEYRRRQRTLQPWYDDMKDLKKQVELMQEEHGAEHGRLRWKQD